MSKCDICGRGQLLYRGNPLVDHAACAVERTERARDTEFLRTLRHELDLRGVSYSNFIVRLMKWHDTDPIPDEWWY